MRAIIFNKLGKILRVVEAPEDALFLQKAENELLLIYSENIANKYVNTESFEVLNLPDKPSDFHIFNWPAKQWDYSEELYSQYLVKLKTSIIVQRNNFLLNSDWSELPSALQRLGEAKISEWQTYRQALRDITTQEGYPSNVVWPSQPV